jgi:hypothetical protein
MKCWSESLNEDKVLRSVIMRVAAVIVVTPCGLVDRH